MYSQPVAEKLNKSIYQNPEIFARLSGRSTVRNSSLLANLVHKLIGKV